MKMAPGLPSKKQFLQGIKEFEKQEGGEHMYAVATFLVNYFWGRPADMSEGLGVLLLTWNQAFYRYGALDFDKLEKVIRKDLQSLGQYRNRSITSFSAKDEEEMTELFNDFLEGVSISINRSKRTTPVGVAKALHLLAPKFFPIWDAKIAQAYACGYARDPAKSYIDYCWKMREFANVAAHYGKPRGKTLVKLIDEYNYAKYTKFLI